MKYADQIMVAMKIFMLRNGKKKMTKERRMEKTVRIKPKKKDEMN